MQLFRIYGYAVTPQRTSDETVDPAGGAFRVNSELREAIDGLFVSSKLAEQSTVDFKVQPQDGSSGRSHPVRSLIIDFAFGTSAEAKVAAIGLASRLANAMDQRSPSSLLMIAASQNGAERRTTIWAFPRDEAFQFRNARGTPSIKLLTDIFSRSSRLRKAALFEGHNRRTDLWSGRVLDLQTTGAFGKAADYWIANFLDCRLGLDDEAGTRILASCLQKTYDSLSDQASKDQLYSAMVAVRTSPRRTWSLRNFANQYLQGDVKSAFLSSAPSRDLVSLSFHFDRTTFEQKLNFRVFHLENDVYVSAPFSAVGANVIVHDGQTRTLQCEGAIIDEKVRARHA